MIQKFMMRPTSPPQKKKLWCCPLGGISEFGSVGQKILVFPLPFFKYQKVKAFGAFSMFLFFYVSPPPPPPIRIGC